MGCARGRNADPSPEVHRRTPAVRRDRRRRHARCGHRPALPARGYSSAGGCVPDVEPSDRRPSARRARRSRRSRTFATRADTPGHTGTRSAPRVGAGGGGLRGLGCRAVAVVAQSAGAAARRRGRRCGRRRSSLPRRPPGPRSAESSPRAASTLRRRLVDRRETSSTDASSFVDTVATDVVLWAAVTAVAAAAVVLWLIGLGRGFL